MQKQVLLNSLPAPSHIQGLLYIVSTVYDNNFLLLSNYIVDNSLKMRFDIG